MTEMMKMVDEAENIGTDSTSCPNELAKILHQSWQIKRSLTQRISNANIDEIYEAGLSAGALGGKLLGAGGGGFMLFYVPPEKRLALRQRLQKLLFVPFGFSNKGSHVVLFEPEEEYDQSIIEERS